MRDPYLFFRRFVAIFPLDYRPTTVHSRNLTLSGIVRVVRTFELNHTSFLSRAWFDPLDRA